MKKVLAVVIGLGVLGNSDAYAANVAAIASPPGMLAIVIFLFACACAVLGFQVLNSVRGGMLGKPWQVFIAGFVVLALSQLGGLLATMEVFLLPDWVVPALRALVIGILFYGVFEMKRVLG